MPRFSGHIGWAFLNCILSPQVLGFRMQFRKGLRPTSLRSSTGLRGAGSLRSLPPLAFAPLRGSSGLRPRGRPTGRWPPPSGAASRAGKCLFRLPGASSLSLSLCWVGALPFRVAQPPAAPAYAGCKRTCPPACLGGAGALPPPQHSALSLRSQLASIFAAAPLVGCCLRRATPRTHQTSPAFSLCSQMAGYAVSSAPVFAGELATVTYRGRIPELRPTARPVWFVLPAGDTAPQPNPGQTVSLAF